MLIRYSDSNISLKVCRLCITEDISFSNFHAYFSRKGSLRIFFSPFHSTSHVTESLSLFQTFPMWADWPSVSQSTSHLRVAALYGGSLLSLLEQYPETARKALAKRNVQLAPVDRKSFYLADLERFCHGDCILFGNYVKFCLDGLFFSEDWQRQSFFPTKKYSVKTQHHSWTLDGSWWRTVICLIISTIKNSWQPIRCYVLYLFLTQQLSTTDGRTCLLSIDRGDLVSHQRTLKCFWTVGRAKQFERYFRILERAIVTISSHFTDCSITLIF